MMHWLKQAISGVRNLVGLGIVSSLNDTGGAMTLNLATGSYVNRADVEVATPWGFSSSPPADGMLAVVFSVGGDPSNLMALHPSNPSARFGNLAVGEAVIYGATGSRVHIRANGDVEIWAVNAKVFSTETVIDAPGGITMNANVQVNGAVVATGNVTWGSGTANEADGFGHAHNYNPGTGSTIQTSPPVPGT